MARLVDYFANMTGLGDTPRGGPTLTVFFLAFLLLAVVVSALSMARARIRRSPGVKGPAHGGKEGPGPR